MRFVGAALAAFFLMLAPAEARRHDGFGGGSVTQFCGDRYCAGGQVASLPKEGRRWRPGVKRHQYRSRWKIAHRSKAAQARQAVRTKAMLARVKARAAARSATVAKPQQVASIDPNAVLGESNPVTAAVRAGTDLLAKARSYLGTNPTGWRSVWCGRFMAMIAPEAAKKVPNPNLARSWLALPKVARRVGVIVVLSRGGSKTAGHIGVVAGVGKRGPIVVSGNFRKRVGVGEYPESRVLAYVSPG